MEYARHYGKELARAKAAHNFDVDMAVDLLKLKIEDKLLTLVNAVEYFGCDERSVTFDNREMSNLFCPGFPYRGLPEEIMVAFKAEMKKYGYECMGQTSAAYPNRYHRIVVAVPATMIRD